MNTQKGSIKILFIIICSIKPLYGQPVESPHDQVMTNKNIFSRTVGLEMVNDFASFWGLGSNDKGYTLGLSLNSRIPYPTLNRYFEISLQSKLYTASAGKPYHNAAGLKIEPQYFAEISFLRVAYHVYRPKKKILLCTEAGLGIYNQKAPIPILALFMQGGEDGKGGFHSLLGTSHARQENIATGGIRANFYAQFSIKEFHFLSKNQHADGTYISVEPGAQIVFPFWKGSRLFCNIHSTIPLIRPKNSHKIKFRIAVLLNSNLSIHTQGLLLIPEMGFEFDFFFLRIGYTNMFLLGKQQDAYIKYSDPDPLMRAYIRVAF